MKAPRCLLAASGLGGAAAAERCAALVCDNVSANVPRASTLACGARTPPTYLQRNIYQRFYLKAGGDIIWR